tara:strand:- start:302 stop:415 length:114 start_codon:yes stop_codon:yes gene_type:complete
MAEKPSEHKDDKQQRLEKALRQNLRRRKAPPKQEPAA